MTAFAGEWVRAIAGAALICAAAIALPPKGRVKGVLKFVCGLVLLSAILSPLLKKDFTLYSMDMSAYRSHAEEITQSTQENQNKLSRTIIEGKLEAYILDKAQSLNVALESAQVTMKWGDEGCWYPYEATLTGNIPQRKKNLLSNAIEAELGIPEENQYWSSYENER